MPFIDICKMFLKKCNYLQLITHYVITIHTVSASYAVHLQNGIFKVGFIYIYFLGFYTSISDHQVRM